jgi:lipopolysaccharide transport system ATP-binding protein
MSDIAIQTENLGKKYVLRHREGPGYGTLRDTIVSAARRLGRRWSGQPPLYPALNREEFWALREVSLAIPRGEVVGIIGRNGAGKSTLLKLLSRITAPTTGRIRFRGRVSSLLEVGTGFHPELSGRENIFLNGAILGMSREEIRRKFDQILAFADTERFLDTPVKRYSSGMYVRLAFSVAAHLEPDILLVDEVLAVGDTAFQRKCLGKMREVATQEGRTVLFVSHNMQAVQSLCTQAAHIENGRLASYGETKHVVAEYLESLGASGSEKTWPPQDAPGNADIRLTALRVRSERQSGAVLSSSSELCVEMDFKATTSPSALCVGFDILTPEGLAVLRTYQTDAPEEQWLPVRVGENRWVCRIPPGLLNGGVYYICPRISIHNVCWIVNLDAVVRFELVLDHGVSPLWNSLTAAARPGVVAPLLRWETRA